MADLRMLRSRTTVTEKSNQLSKETKSSKSTQRNKNANFTAPVLKENNAGVFSTNCKALRNRVILTEKSNQPNEEVKSTQDKIVKCTSSVLKENNAGVNSTNHKGPRGQAVLPSKSHRILKENNPLELKQNKKLKVVAFGQKEKDKKSMCTSNYKTLTHKNIFAPKKNSTLKQNTKNVKDLALTNKGQDLFCTKKTNLKQTLISDYKSARPLRSKVIKQETISFPEGQVSDDSKLALSKTENLKGKKYTKKVKNKLTESSVKAITSNIEINKCKNFSNKGRKCIEKKDKIQKSAQLDKDILILKNFTTNISSGKNAFNKCRQSNTVKRHIPIWKLMVDVKLQQKASNVDVYNIEFDEDMLCDVADPKHKKKRAVKKVNKKIVKTSAENQVSGQNGKAKKEMVNITKNGMHLNYGENFKTSSAKTKDKGIFPFQAPTSEATIEKAFVQDIDVDVASKKDGVFQKKDDCQENMDCNREAEQEEFRVPLSTINCYFQAHLLREADDIQSMELDIPNIEAETIDNVTFMSNIADELERSIIPASTPEEIRSNLKNNKTPELPGLSFIPSLDKDPQIVKVSNAIVTSTPVENESNPQKKNLKNIPAMPYSVRDTVENIVQPEILTVTDSVDKDITLFESPIKQKKSFKQGILKFKPPKQFMQFDFFDESLNCPSTLVRLEESVLKPNKAYHTPDHFKAHLVKTKRGFANEKKVVKMTKQDILIEKMTQHFAEVCETELCVE